VVVIVLVSVYCKRMEEVRMNELVKLLRGVGEGVVLSKSEWCKLGVESGYVGKGGRGGGGVKEKVVGGGGVVVKRARSAYVLFTKSKLSKEEEEMKSEGMKFMSIRSKTWKKMDEEARRPYVEASNKEKMLIKEGGVVKKEENKKKRGRPKKVKEVVEKEVVEKKAVKKKKRGRPKKVEENEELTPRDRAEIMSESAIDDAVKEILEDEIEVDFGSDVEEVKEMIGYHEHNGVRYELSEFDELIDPDTKRPVGSLDDGEVIMFE